MKGKELVPPFSSSLNFASNSQLIDGSSRQGYRVVSSLFFAYGGSAFALHSFETSNEVGITQTRFRVTQRARDCCGSTEETDKARRSRC